MRRGRAEVAGGGIAGLGVATMLARRGWSVTVHERNETIREVGAGIYLRNNPLRVLEALGITSDIRPDGIELERSQMRDGNGRVLQDHALTGERRLWICPRQVLIQGLERTARSAGVVVSAGSPIIGARPEGVLVGERGEEFAADLVVGADGLLSKVRESLGLTRHQRFLPTIATRYLAQTRELDIPFLPQTTMYWSGKRRVGVAPCSRDETYVFMISPESDTEGKATPMNVDSWSRSFPVLERLFAGLEPYQPIQHNYAIVKCSRWQSGRVGIIGDAAHGLPPLLGQGAGLALSNASALASTVGGDPTSVPERLQQWEIEYRHYADVTQRWSLRLDAITNRWPQALLFARKGLIWGLGKPPFQRKMRVADSFPILEASID